MDGAEFIQAGPDAGAFDVAPQPPCGVVAATPELRALVAGHWFLRAGVGHGMTPGPSTAPRAVAVLMLEFERAHGARHDGRAPAISLCGLQSHARAWRAGAESSLIMVMITVGGLAALFPGDGAHLLDRQVALDDVIGARECGALRESVRAAGSPSAAPRVIDAWLAARSERIGAWHRQRRVVAALDELRSHGRVASAARRAALSVRHLQRWTRRHAGVTPKQLCELDRLQRSIADVQLGRSAGDSPFCDQSHEIRTWRRRLPITPGQYRRGGMSSLARLFSDAQRLHRPYVAFFL